MQEKSRIANATRNVIFGIISQFLILLFSFVSRKIFIMVLDAEYLGINGLFSNILTVLSLADLGIGNAIIFSMYKPLAEHNEKKISALMNLYRKIYMVIAIIVAAVGIAILPFLDILVKTEKTIENLHIYFLLFLADSVVSYLLANRSAILNADQKEYITKIYTVIISLIRHILQAMVLFVTHNFILYLVIQIIATFCINLCGAIVAKKMYPFINKKDKLDKIERKSIFANIKSIMIYKISGVILNNTDNILISILAGTVWVGYYSNYTMIIGAIITFINIIISAINASVGNLNATKDKQKQLQIFYTINMICNWIFGFCSVALIILLNDFICMAFGEKYILNIATTIIIVINFYMPGILNPICIYRDTTGLFKETKYVFTITAILNIIFSVILGKYFGLFGILLATAISRLLTNFWYEPYVLMKKYFNETPIKYFKKTLSYCITFICSIFIILLIENIINITNIYIKFIFNIIQCIIIPNLLCYIMNRKTEEFKYIQNNILNKYIAKLKSIFVKRKKM